MNPQNLFCPNFACPARGQTGEGNIIGHGRKKPRFKCKVCRQTFCPTTGTPWHRVHYPASVVTQVVTLLAWGCPVQAIVWAFALDERTVLDWQARAASQCQAVQQHFLTGADLAGEVQADELRIKGRGVIFWLACALHVPTRLWLGGEVSPRRDRQLIRHTLEWVKQAVNPKRYLLLMTDGLSSYTSQARVVFRDKVVSKLAGRPRQVVWETLLVANVVKQYSQRRVTGVIHRIKHGAAELVEAVRHRACTMGVLNTAYIERWNGTLRQRLNSVVRRGRNAVATSGRLRAGMWLVGTAYNFCTGHESLRVSWLDEAGRKHWSERSPAMAAGLTNHVWSVEELLRYRLPPSRWEPPRKRGRRSKEVKKLMKRWCSSAHT